MQVIGALRGWADSVRRNHGLEHATVAVLLARHGPRRIAGRATVDGFFILGDVDLEELRSCADEALARLNGGQSSLAVSPLCGTNIAIAGLLAASGATLVLSRGRGMFGNAFTAAMVGALLSQPVGRVVQQHVTTSHNLTGVEVVGAREVFHSLKKIETRHRPG
jgi:hypothetical protein